MERIRKKHDEMDCFAINYCKILVVLISDCKHNKMGGKVRSVTTMMEFQGELQVAGGNLIVVGMFMSLI